MGRANSIGLQPEDFHSGGLSLSHGTRPTPFACRALIQFVVVAILTLLLVGCGADGASAPNGMNAYVEAGPVSLSQINSSGQFRSGTDGSQPLMVSNVPLTELPIRMAHLPVTASVSFGSTPRHAGVSIQSLPPAAAVLFQANAFGVNEPPALPPIPPLSMANGLRMSVNSAIDGNVPDDGLVMQLADVTFSGIPSGSNVTVTNLSNGNTRYQVAGFMSNGSLVFLEYLRLKFPSVHYPGGTEFSRTITINRPEVGVTIANATATGTVAGQNTTLSFDIIETGEPPPDIHQWTVSIKKNGNTFHTFSAGEVGGDTRGPGQVTGSDHGVHVTLPWNGSNGNTTITGDFSWVMAANVTDVAHGGQPGQGGTAVLELEQQQKSVRILNATAPALEPSSGGNTTLGFDLEAVGLGPSPEFQWSVSVIETDTNTTLMTFPDQGAGGPGNVTSNSGTSLHIDLLWDGKVNGSPVNSNFTWVIDANASQLVAGGTPNNEVAQQVQVANAAPELEVTDSSGRVIGSSLDSLVPVGSVLDSAGTARLRAVFPYNRPQQSNQWKIQVKNLGPDLDLTAEVVGTVSGTNISIPLNFVGNGTYSITSATILSQVIKQQGLASTTYTAADLFSKPDAAPSFANDFFSKMASLGSGVVTYPTNRVGLGRLQSFLATSLVRPGDDLAQDTMQNLRCFGFEAVKVQVTTPSGPLTALIKVRHPASIAYVVAHGNHTGRITSTQNIAGTVLSPLTDLVNDDTATLKTLFLASCNALDMHDYNNNYVGKPQLDPSRIGPSDPITLRDSPGKLWWSKTRTNNTVLLGYSFPVAAAGARAGTGVYFEQLALVQGQPDAEPLAWLKAHIELFQRFGRSFPQVLAACCWTTTDHYFISFQPPLQAVGDPDPLSSGRRIEGAYRIPLDATGDNTAVTFTSPPTMGGVTKVPQIP